MENKFLKLITDQKSDFQVKDIMTHRVYVLYENDNLDVARLLMEAVHIRHIPVVTKDDRFVGLLTHRDMLKLSFSSLAELDENAQKEIHQGIPLRDVINRDVQTISPLDNLKYAIKQIISNKYGCLPVTEDNRLVGIITEADFVKFTYNLLNFVDENKT